VSDLPDTGVQTMLEIDDGVGTPDGFPKRRSRHERAGPVDQQRQYPERLRRQLDDLTTPYQDMIDRIKIELSEAPYTARRTLLTEKLSESYSFSIARASCFATSRGSDMRAVLGMPHKRLG
jgi:hypothetical protein